MLILIIFVFGIFHSTRVGPHRRTVLGAQCESKKIYIIYYLMYTSMRCLRKKHYMWIYICILFIYLPVNYTDAYIVYYTALYWCSSVKFRRIREPIPIPIYVILYIIINTSASQHMYIASACVSILYII